MQGRGIVGWNIITYYFITEYVGMGYFFFPLISIPEKNGDPPPFNTVK
jgi:hypothetical protein